MRKNYEKHLYFHAIDYSSWQVRCECERIILFMTKFKLDFLGEIKGKKFKQIMTSGNGRPVDDYEIKREKMRNRTRRTFNMARQGSRG